MSGGTATERDVVTSEIVREALRGDGDGDGDGDESALPEASGERALVTENRSSQPLATLLVYTRRDFWRARSALAACRRRPIDADRSRPPHTTLTLTPITRNYVLLLTARIYAYIYIYIYTHTHAHTYIYIYIYARVCTPIAAAFSPPLRSVSARSVQHRSQRSTV